MGIRTLPFPTRLLPSITQISPWFRCLNTLSQILPKFSHQSHFFLHSASQLSPRSTMAGESESFSNVSDENIKYGFERAEMHQSSLAGTVDPYDCHFFLCYKSHESWPSRVEDSESDPLPKSLASALKARKDEIGLKTRLTICEGGNDVKLSDGDVLIFPDMVIYRGVKDSDVDSLIDDRLLTSKPWQSAVLEKLTGSYVFVCAHNNRDRRCGVCGPVLIEKFKEEIESKNLKDQVFVTACSHVGGHKYAGNVIIFGAGPDGEVSGNWYGYVTPSDVAELLDVQIGKGEVVSRIWRGQMGRNVKEPEKVEEPKLANGTSVDSEKQPKEIGTQEKTENVESCCQGANGISCCRDENAKKKAVEMEPKGLSCWPRKWEQHHVLTTVAVVGAVAAVAIAYGFFRRSR